MFERYKILDSTNAEARRLWNDQHREEAFAVFAEEQTEGIGRDGRRWHSPKGGIWLTIAWPMKDRLPKHFVALPLAVGNAVAEVLGNILPSKDVDIAIKWPNDVYIDGKKIAGILCQTESGMKYPAIFIGVGINGDYTADVLGKDLRNPATTLREVLGPDVKIDIDLIVGDLVRYLDRALSVYTNEGIKPFLDAIDRRLLWKGEKVEAGSETGKVIGIGKDGSLILDTKSGLKSIISGEVTSLSRYDG